MSSWAPPFTATLTIRNSTGQHMFLQLAEAFKGRWQVEPQVTINPAATSANTVVEDHNGTTGAYGRVIYRIDERGTPYRFTITVHAALRGDNEVTWSINPPTNLFRIDFVRRPNQGHHIVVPIVISRSARAFASFNEDHMDALPFIMYYKEQENAAEEEEC